MLAEQTTTIGDEVARICTELDYSDRYRSFFVHFRASDISFIPCRKGIDAIDLHQALIDLLLKIGEIGIPEGVGAAMHLYMLTSFAKFPIPEENLAARRNNFVQIVHTNRYLIANTGSDDQTRSANALTSSTVARRTADGILVTGRKTFLSLARVADIVLFTALAEGNPVFMVVPLSSPGIAVKESHFHESFPMETYAIEFNDVFVPPEMIFEDSNPGAPMASIHVFQRSLFQSIISAVYLGAARRSLMEAAKFSHAQGLSNLDGVQVELGKLSLQLESALTGSRMCGKSFAAFLDAPSDKTLNAFSTAASVAKYSGCSTAAEIVGAVQRFIGTRCMEPGHAMAEIVRLAPFGPLHPVVGALTERTAGKHVLAQVE